MTDTNLDRALHAVKRIGSFSEGEKDALIKAFRTSMFPGSWSIGTPNDNDILQYDAATDTWETAAPPGDTFLGLTDTPATYATSNSFFRINAGLTALEAVGPMDMMDAIVPFIDVAPNNKDIITFGSYGGPTGWGSKPITDVESVNSVNSATGAVVLDIDDVTPTTTKGDIIVENGTNAIRLPIGTDTHVLTADSAEASGVKWAAAPSGFADPMTTRGDIIYKNAAGTTTRLPAGTANYVLTSDGTDIAWAASVAGVSVFTSLTDTPANFTGHGGKLVAVNGGETALEFVTGGTVTTVSASAPVASSGGTTPNISMAAATSGNHGYMTSTYASKLDGIEAGADVTDATNVAAAGAFMGDITISSAAPSSGNDGDIWFQVA